MNVLFIGSQNIGYLCMKKLYELGIKVACVITFKPEPHERWQNSVDGLADQNGIPLYWDVNLNNKSGLDLVKSYDPDIIFVIGWRRLIAKEILKVPPLGCIALHASLLPKYRGHAPVNWAVINGEKKTGITLFYLEDDIDTGDIIGKKEIIIEDQDDIATIKSKIDLSAAELINTYVPLLKQGIAPRTPQNHNDASYGCLRTPDDGIINWSENTINIYNLIRSITFPYHGAFTYYEKKKLFVWKASLYNGMKFIGIKGQIAKINKGGNVLIITGDGVISIEKVQEEGKDIVNAGDYFNSIRTKLSTDKN